jgi:hypothetical protein
VVVTGEGGGEPDGHLFEWHICIGVVGGGEEVSAVHGEPPSLCAFHMRGPGPMNEPDVCRLDLLSLFVGDVEPQGLPAVVFEPFRTDCDGGVDAVAVVVAAVAATMSATSRGFILFVAFNLFKAVFCLNGALLGVVGFVHRIAEASIEDSEGGGEVFGVVQ